MRPNYIPLPNLIAEFLPDAVPKKRGPKTDVLEALVKRVNGLEQRMQDENKSPTSFAKKPEERNTLDASSFDSHDPTDKRPSLSSPLVQQVDPFTRPTGHMPLSDFSRPVPSQNEVLSIGLLDSYFARLHGKPFYILDEPSVRKRYQMNELPAHLSLAILALTIRYGL